MIDVNDSNPLVGAKNGLKYSSFNANSVFTSDKQILVVGGCQEKEEDKMQ